MMWSTMRVVQLLSCQLGAAVLASEGAETQVEGASGGSPEGSVDELLTVWESVRIGPFQTEIIEGWVKPLFRDTSYVMITPLRAEGLPQETKPLTPGLHVLHAYTRLKNGSERVSLVVRNISDSNIFLKKGLPVAQVVSASLVPPAELSSEMEATLGAEYQPKPMSVAERQEKLLEKLNLDGLAHWSPENAVAVRELVLAYHDVFTLESNELGCTSAIEQEICIKNDEPFKEWFWRIPPPLSEICRKQERFIQANPLGARWSSWSRRKTVLCISVWSSGTSTQERRRTCTPCLRFRRPWKAWRGWHICHQWISSWASGKSRWPRDPNSTRPLRWVTLSSMSLPACRLVCAMHPRHSSISCRIPWAN